MNYDAVIVASGKGERANLGYNKTFYKMKDNKSVLMHSGLSVSALMRADRHMWYAP